MTTNHDSTKDTALHGLTRLAVGGIGDVAKLMYGASERCDKELAAMDLFAVSEIKRGKDGMLEVKLFDRLKALEMLLRYEDGDDAAASFFSALTAAAEHTGTADTYEGGDDHAL